MPEFKPVLMYVPSPVKVVCLGLFAFRPILTVFLLTEKMCLTVDLIFLCLGLRTGQEKEMNSHEEIVHL